MSLSMGLEIRLRITCCCAVCDEPMSEKADARRFTVSLYGCASGSVLAEQGICPLCYFRSSSSLTDRWLQHRSAQTHRAHDSVIAAASGLPFDLV